MNNYNEIKTNLINNFFNKHFRYTTVSTKKMLVESIDQLCPFACKFNYENDNMTVILGNNINIDFHFIFKESEYTNKLNYKTNSYKLVNII